MNPAETPVSTAESNTPHRTGFHPIKSRRSVAGVLLLSVLTWAAPSLFSQTEAYSFSTIAGVGGRTGNSDGTGGGVGYPLFYGPTGVAVNKDGNVYVTDTGNSLIRVVTPPTDGHTAVVTTFAGMVGQTGVADGTGISASFYSPLGPAVDSAGNLYVADYGTYTIRKITTTGVVSTLAGLAVNSGTTDGTGTAARFYHPSGVAVDSSGTVYVADTGSHTIRKVTSLGVVTTLAGTAGVSGSMDGTGTAARFTFPRSVAVDSSGNIYVADTGNNTIRMITSAGVVTTLAGKDGTFGNVDGVGTAARFNFPNALSLDSAGNLFVADELNHTVRKVTIVVSGSARTATVSTLAGSPGVSGRVDGTGSAAKFSHPTGVAADASGNVYVADYYNNQIRKVTAAGVVTTVAGVGGVNGAQDGAGYSYSPAMFYNPSSTTVDNTGTVYVADTSNNLIRRVSSVGVVTNLAGNVGAAGRTDGTGTAASFNTPTGVAIDGSGNVFVADSANHLIRKVNKDGVVTTFAGTGGTAGSADGAGTSASFNYPSGVAVDGGGNVYVADYGNHTVRKITAAGQVSTLAGTAGTAGSSATTFNHPRGVAVDASGYVYVADTGNHTIRKIAPGGLVITLAGTAGSAGTADGAGAIARFNGPAGLTVDSAGNVFVTDTNSSTVRLVTLAGVVTTIGGVAGKAGDVDGKGLIAQFSFPTGVAVDAAGNLYIADNRNHTIRKGTTATSINNSGGSGNPTSVTGPFGGSSGGSSGTGGTGGTDGTGGSGGTPVGAGVLLRPGGISMDSSYVVYVADTANNTIKKVASDGTTTVFAGKEGSAGSADGTGTAALFNGPTGILVDSSYNVYVSDTGNATIRKITSAGVVTTIAGAAGSRGTTDGTSTAALFSSPTGLTMDGLGNLYVSDSTNNTIRMITSAGVVTTYAGAARSSGDADGVRGAARFNNPTGLAIDGSNNLYVADTYNNTIRKIKTTARSVSVTAVGDIVDAGNAKVVVTDAGLTGSPITLSVAVLAADSPTTWAAKVVTAIAANTAIAARYSPTSSGAVITMTYLTTDETTLSISLANDTCTGITAASANTATALAGTVTTIAGSPGLSGAYDGTGGYALFNLPQGLGVDTGGNVYVADTGNSCIRVVTPKGVVVTVAGIAGVAGNKDGVAGVALFNQPQALFVSSSIIVADTGNSLIRTINSLSTTTTVALKAPATTTPDTGSGSSSGGGGGIEPWFVAALLTLFGVVRMNRRKL